MQEYWVLGLIYTDRKEDTAYANIVGHSNLQDTLYYIVMLTVGFDMICTWTWKKSVDRDTFNLILQIPERLFMFMLVDHDDIFNAVFLDFINKTWSIRSES